MKKLSYLLIVLLFVVSANCKCLLGKETTKPNVLFLFTDDQRFDTIAALGNEAIKTPHIDSIVRSGVTFRNAYIMGASSPAVCAPSRACLMSGQTLWNAESQGLWSSKVSDKFTSLPQVFKENGYRSFGTGKQHNGHGSFVRSFNAGAKILFRGMTSSQYNLPLCEYSPSGDYKKTIISKGKHSAEVYADATIRFLEENAKSKEPFFAYVSFQTPHDPRQMPKEYKDMYDPASIKLPASFQTKHPFDNGMLKIRDEGLARTPRKPKEIQRHIAEYYAMVTHTDAQIGRIMEALKKSGKADNTIVVFSSDNGLAVGRHGLMGKQNVYEHGVHVPLVISGPGIPKGEMREQLCYIYDIYPTLCQRVGLKVPDNVQYKSLNPVIEDSSKKIRDHLYFAFMSWQRSIRDKQYKLIEYCVKNKRYTQLFDLSVDPLELRNLAGDAKYADKLADLRAILKKERVLLNDGNTKYKFADKQGKTFWKIMESTKETEFPQLNKVDLK